LTNKESQTTEFKPNWRDEYLKTICAFANTEGGKLIIGVNDKGDPLGLKNAKKLLEDIPNKAKNKLGIIPSVKVERREDKETISIEIKHSSVLISYDGKFYVRSGSTTHQLKGQGLANLILKKIGKTWDELCEKRFSFDGINKETIEGFKRLAADRIPSIIKEEDVEIIFRKLNLIEDGELKRAAILLFGKNPQEFYPNALIKIGKFLTETEILTTDIVEGNLFEQLNNTIEILRTKYLVSNIKYEGIHRRDILEYPYEALREAVINALIHRDYLGTSNIQIRIYKDKLLIMNEGKLHPEVPVESLKTNHLSKPRNELLARIFYYAGLIEAWGRGTIKIVEECKEQGLPEPDFIEKYGVMTVKFYKDIYTEEYLKKLGLNERQIKAVMYVKENNRITNQEYRKLNNVSNKTAYLELENLVEKSIFSTEGRGKALTYIVR